MVSKTKAFSNPNSSFDQKLCGASSRKSLFASQPASLSVTKPRTHFLVCDSVTLQLLALAFRNDCPERGEPSLDDEAQARVAVGCDCVWVCRVCFCGCETLEIHVTFVLAEVRLERLLHCFPFSLCLRSAGVPDFFACEFMEHGIKLTRSFCLGQKYKAYLVLSQMDKSAFYLRH